MLKQYNDLVNDTLDNIFEVTKSENKELNKIIQQYFLNGGKRIRVLLSLICSKLGTNKNNKDIINIASIIEIIHTASLIHDDIIDKAITRRGAITLNKKYGNEQALYVGDYLFAVVLNEVAKVKDVRIHNYLAKTLKELCIGEIIQNSGLYNLKTRRLDYLKKIKRKTAILIAFSCAAGAIISEAKDEDIKACYSYGYYLGMSYQIIDDYLDFVGGSEVLGKEVGQDVRNGNITLPVLIAKEKDNNLFDNYSKTSDDNSKKRIIEFINTDKSILNETLKISQNYSNKAIKSIENINLEVRKELTYIVDELAGRNK